MAVLSIAAIIKDGEWFRFETPFSEVDSNRESHFTKREGKMQKATKLLFVFILLVSFVEPGRADTVPDIRGVYTGSYTTVVSNCTDPSSNGFYKAALVIDIPNQTGNTFSGTATGTFELDGSTATENITLTGTIKTTGGITGDTSHTFLGTAGEGTFVGLLVANTLTIENPGHDTVGETCMYKRSMLATRQGGIPPSAEFTANPTSGNAPLTVNFTDQSTGTITSWDWDFGDGSNSTDQNPSHTYNDADSYSVSLTVSGPDGSDTELKLFYIDVLSDLPSVTTHWPASGATDVPVDTVVSATFSEAMDASTINETTFLVNDGSTNIDGKVSYENTTATFTPTTNLVCEKTYTATITTGARDMAGNALEADYSWPFTTGPIQHKTTFTLDYYPLDQGSQWTYSVSPSTLTFDVEGETVSMTLSDVSVSIPSDLQRLTEMTFTGTVDGDSFSGNARCEEYYFVHSGLIQLVSEETSVSMSMPSYQASATYSQVATHLSPLTVLEQGMKTGDSISNRGRVKVDWTLDYTEAGQHERESGTDEFFVSIATTILGEEEIVFDGNHLDTIKVQMDMTLDGESSKRTMNLSRFIGEVKSVGKLPGIEEFFDNIDQVTTTLKSTNLPVWNTIDNYAVDSSTGRTFDFDLNGGAAEINIPADTLSDSCSLTVADISNIPESPGMNGITWAVGIAIDDPTVTLKDPVTVTIPYTHADLDSAGITDPTALKVYQWSLPSSGWEALSVETVDIDHQTVSFEVSQLSIFGLGAPSHDGGGGGCCFISTAGMSLGW